MIYIKSTSEIAKMRRSGRIVYDTFAHLKPLIQAGVTTKELDTAAEEFIRSQGAIPSFLNYNGFPASICASVNNVVIHGIPGGQRLKDGDIISIDIGAVYDGYHGDACRTFAVGEVSAQRKRLMEVTEQSFFKGLEFARHGERLFSISAAIQEYVESNGFSIVRNYCGHGIGRNLHEDPEVPNYGRAGHGIRLMKGMTIAVEPMVNAGGFATKTLRDGWTVVTEDGSDAAHYENTILITDGEPELTTYY
ncbi:MAG: type I methionyl aminopeptidase [Ruminococcaceae bacterium]|nr:type I methionyl aminopeptidase [Oscillospiraceae bacterium]